MFVEYLDILERITETPKWWDEWAVPRYCVFDPQRIVNLDAHEAALVEIRCSDCGQHSLAAFSWPELETYNEECSSLAEGIQKGVIAYGDPPNYCCRAGPSMTCRNLRVHEYWTRMNAERVWRRDASLEIVLPDGEGRTKGL
jgi:hypothetical protein